VAHVISMENLSDISKPSALPNKQTALKLNSPRVC